MIDRISAVYVENEIEFSWLMNQVPVMMKTRQDNNLTDCIGVVFWKTILNYHDGSD